MLKVTTSWDDGDILDRRLADLLSQHSAKGTFYITKNYRPNRLTDQDIMQLATGHEIGAHTLTHPDLRTLSPEEKKKEIVGSKEWLEQIITKRVKMFCYPKGYYDSLVVNTVQNAGFLGARTTELGALSFSNPFQIGTTLQVYPFPFRKVGPKKYYWKKIFQPYQERSLSLRALGVSRFEMTSWFNMAKSTFDCAQKNGGVFHLWGHSWEIEKYDMWEELEKFLRYINNQPKFSFVTNGELIN